MKKITDLRKSGDLITHDDHKQPLEKDAEGNVASVGLPSPSDEGENHLFQVGNEPTVVLG